MVATLARVTLFKNIDKNVCPLFSLKLHYIQFVLIGVHHLLYLLVADRVELRTPYPVCI